MPPKKCKDNEVLNPTTDRCIKIRGQTYSRIFPNRSELGKQIQNRTRQARQARQTRETRKKCKPGEALNTHTNRCIKIGTQLYRHALRQGWIKQDSDKKSSDKKSSRTDVPGVEETKDEEGVEETKDEEDVVRRGPRGSNSSRTKKRNKCKNKDTFMMFTDVKDIEDNDFIMTDEGFCFSAEELVAFIASEAFNNKNPHDLSKELFINDPLNNEYIKKHPELIAVIKSYFTKKHKEQIDAIKVMERNIEILYEICNTGRICAFNSATSFDTDDSSGFARSIDALAKLSQRLDNLSEKEKEVYKYAIKKTDEANKGEMCIHGVGLYLMDYFIKMFSKFDIEYDSMKTGLYFFLHAINRKKYLFIVSNEHRFTYDTSKHPLMLSNNEKYIKLIKPNMLESDLDRKSKVYENKCAFDSDMVTIESADSWKEIPDWRKITLDDDICFDLLFLVKIITTDLNNAKNNNPYPKYPRNPFTRKIFTQDELTHIKILLDDNYVKLNEPLNYFLNEPSLWLNSINNDDDENRWRNRMVDRLERANLRFVRKVNIIHDELHCIGEWNINSYPISPNENTILLFLQHGEDRYLNKLKRLRPETTPDEYYYRLRVNPSDQTILVEKLLRRPGGARAPPQRPGGPRAPPVVINPLVGFDDPD